MLTKNRKYFIFDFSTNKKEIGATYPQVQKMVEGYDYKAPNSVHALSRERKTIPSFEPNLEYFVVHPKAKLTDC